MTEVELIQCRKRVRRAGSPTAARTRQCALETRDANAFYDFAVLAHPLRKVAPVFAKGAAARAALPAAAADDPPTPERTLDAERCALMSGIDRLVADLQAALSRSARELDEGSARLEALLRQQRLAVFRIDFGAHQRFPLIAGTCQLCNRACRVMTFACCRRESNTPTACVDCLEQSAFASSACGTELCARCPYCSASYAVYDAGIMGRRGGANKRKRAADSA